MGSLITLGVGKLEIDWGKNHFFNDHSCLFLPEDIKKIAYYYADNAIENKKGLSRALGSVKRRLDLLGYSLGELKNLYQESLENIPDYYPDVNMDFEQFKTLMSSINLNKIGLETNYEDYDLGEFISKYLFRENEFTNRIPNNVKLDNDFGTFLENLDPYIILRLLAENPKNLNKNVQWRYTDVVEGGWVDENEIVKPLPIESKILIVTEGSSDSYIIEKSMKKLMPDIVDFFYFVDMEENYPFTGTGNLYRFCQGLSSIQIQNKTLVLFDNDAAGVESYEKCKKLKLPNNMKICRLPDHEDFRNFETIGPSGKSIEDINGSAVAIECFLDLQSVRDSKLRWTSYNKCLNCYQGEIENKSQLVKVFKKSDLKDGYNTEKLKYLLNHIINIWVMK